MSKKAVEGKCWRLSLVLQFLSNAFRTGLAWSSVVKQDAFKKLRKSINELIIVVSGKTMETPMILGFARKFPCRCRPELSCEVKVE
jgi:hypothetical protein